uniref:Follistatin-related protein 4-like n=1 Tax=Petromyzon marinus TaxID=7757 RepID=A0AAJ7WQ52_PETMA|nr:follistatin-related protein 4-like [Petromyzon marinus]
MGWGYGVVVRSALELKFRGSCRSLLGSAALHSGFFLIEENARSCNSSSNSNSSSRDGDGVSRNGTRPAHGRGARRSAPESVELCALECGALRLRHQGQHREQLQHQGQHHEQDAPLPGRSRTASEGGAGRRGERHAEVPVYVVANSGERVELPCALGRGAPHGWRRNHVRLSPSSADGITVASDGSHRLVFPRVSVLHAGTYSCCCNNASGGGQSVALLVRVPPAVRVAVSSQLRQPGQPAVLTCHADGIPRPRITWFKNGEKVVPDPYHHVSLQGGGQELRIGRVRYEDTAAYTCQARNPAGTRQRISSLFVKDLPFKPRPPPRRNVLYAFGGGGGSVSLLAPDSCDVRRLDLGAEGAAPHAERLCGDAGECPWGSAVVVANKFIFVAQPLQNRVVVVDVFAQKAVQIIPTVPSPGRLVYEAARDRVWVLSAARNRSAGQSLQVIHEATSGGSGHGSGRVSETLPGTACTSLGDLHIPSSPLLPAARFGLLACSRRPLLYKVDLLRLRLARRVSLAPWGCAPRAIAFSPRGARYVVACAAAAPAGAAGAASRRRRGAPFPQLVLDGVTDAVVGRNGGAAGTPHVSPDGRHVVSVASERSSRPSPRTRRSGSPEASSAKSRSAGGGASRPAPCDPDGAGDFARTNPLRASCAHRSGSIVHVQTLSAAGETVEWFVLHTRLAVSGVLFQPARRPGSGYNVYVGLRDRPDLLLIEPQTGNWSFISTGKFVRKNPAHGQRTAGVNIRETVDAGKLQQDPLKHFSHSLPVLEGLRIGRGAAAARQTLAAEWQLVDSGLFGQHLLRWGQKSLLVLEADPWRVSCWLSWKDVPDTVVWVAED